MDELLKDFLIECHENLARLDREVVELERQPECREILESVFRTVHTLKGGCAFLGLKRIQKLAHVAEDALDCMRESRLPVNAKTIDPVLSAIDRIRHILVDLEANQVEPPGNDDEVLAALGRAIDSGVTGPGREAEIARAPLPVPRPEKPAPASAPGILRPSTAPQSVRVNLELLDRLQHRTGELVLTCNHLRRIASEDGRRELTTSVSRLARVTAEIEEDVRSSRMREIGTVWQRLPRVLRDLCATSGKRIQLELQGAETELDRQVLQALDDPLLHMLRNSAAHGIELPHERRAAGKPEVGTVTISARQASERVIIEIADDGAGIDPSVVRRTAIEQSLIDPRDPAWDSDAEVLECLFEPGFTTAERVTSVSGRGVGLDVVRSSLRAIGGDVHLSSARGEGTTIQISVPLTISVARVLVVSEAGQRFALPLPEVIEIVRPVDRLAGMDRGTEARRDLAENLPLVRLRDLLRLSGRSASTFEAAAREFVVVLAVNRRHFGLVVDAVCDTREVVLERPGRAASRPGLYAAATILGDGCVALVLDPASLASRSGIRHGLEAESESIDKNAPTTSCSSDQKMDVLVFKTADGRRRAVPLDVVTRLQHVRAEQIEVSDGYGLAWQDGRSMAIVAADPHLPLGEIDPQPVVVVAGETQHGEADTFALAVLEIDDIVRVRANLDTSPGDTGIAGKVTIDECEIELLNTEYLLRGCRYSAPSG